MICLEDVKTVNIGNEMAVTVSIGIGLDGLTYAQNYEFATQCDRPRTWARRRSGGCKDTEEYRLLWEARASR